jgi:hypothetical protein
MPQRKRPPYGPTDHLLALLYKVIAAPHTLETTRNEFEHSLPTVIRPDHRQFLDSTFREIERSRNSPQDLARIEKKVGDWQDREFPVK